MPTAASTSHDPVPPEAGSLSATVRPRCAQHRSDRALAEWARTQHGILTLAQLERLGLSGRAVRHRAAAGRLVRVQAGVYSVGPPTAEGRWLGAVLVCGEGAVLSHRSAAALWELSADRGVPNVMSGSRTGRRRQGITVHRGDTLVAADIAIERQIQCTTPARTLLDLAGVVDRRTLERAVDRAEALRIFDLHACEEVLRRDPRRRGRALFATVLDGYSGATVTRSGAEERMLALVDEAALPRPRVNAWIALQEGGGYEADFLWGDQRLIVEVDGRAHHATMRAFVRDRRLAASGYETRRYAASELVAAPRRVAAEIATFIAQRTPGP